EVGELPLDIQPKLLRVLENREVRPLGSSTAVKVDVRVIAATHRDLAAMVRAGTFRQDLYYRLAVVRLELPPRRERREYRPGLICELVKSLAPASRPIALSDEAVSLLQGQSWPGNVRELRNVLERTIALATGDRIQAPEVLLSSACLAPAGGG